MGQEVDGDDRATFANVLRVAIEDSGLSLDRVQQRLKDRGANVSVAALSYWQSGRSAPRRGSLPALGVLEQVLGVAPGSLVDLVPQRRPEHQSVLFPGTPKIKRGMDMPALLAALAVQRRRYERLSDHSVWTIGPDHHVVSRWNRKIIRACVDQLDRLLVLDAVADVSAPAPRVDAVAHCTVGARHTFDPGRLVVTELLFDRALPKGAPYMYEVNCVYGPPYPYETSLEFTVNTVMRELVWEVQFDPGALPTRCEYFQELLPGPQPAGPLRPIELSSTNSILLVLHDLPPMKLVLRWFWD